MRALFNILCTPCHEPALTVLSELMDPDTVDHYDKKAKQFEELYRKALQAPYHKLLEKWLKPPGGCGKSGCPEITRVLEIGCGIGLDAYYMACTLGLDVTAADASRQMLEIAASSAPGSAGSKIKYINASFPLEPGSTLLDEKFDAVVASAVIMHIPDNEVQDFIRQGGKMLNKKGVFICSFCYSRPGVPDDPRLFKDRSPQDLRLLFEGSGFSLLDREESPDSLGRPIKWSTMIFTKNSF